MNNLAPELIHNVPLETWQQRMTTITDNHLFFSDVDNPPEEIAYLLSNVQGGHVAYESNPSVAVSTFSQAEINSGSIVFIASGEGILCKIMYIIRHDA